MKKIHFFFIFLIGLCACSTSDSPENGNGNQQTTVADGLSYSPTSPDADQSLTITFKATASSALYGYTGDVYLYSGIISEGNWVYQPSSWTDNADKYKMTRKSDNVWSITLSPSVRSWFNSGTTPINKLGILVRSSDGNLKGIAEDSFVTVTDSKYKAFQTEAITEKTMPTGLDYGINVIDNSTVTLVLFDKDVNGNHKDFAYVVGDFNNWTLANDASSKMYRDNTAGCWWITLSNLDASKEYAFQYYLGTKSTNEIIRLADPYARKVLDPNNDKYISSSVYTDAKTYPTATGVTGIVSVFKIKHDTYSWKVSDFTISNPDNLVIYELLLRDFTTTGTAGSGNLKLAEEKLDYLKTLGVNAIELMPIQEFDGNNSWGYNPCFFFAMDKAYGTDQMYKEFIDACHQRGLAVILDVVYNHATGNCPLAKLYWDSSSSKVASNNPWFNMSAPHPYSYYNDFNHSSSLTRKFINRNLKFLLTEYKVDGFRFDFSKGFTQKSSTESTAGNYDASRIAILEDYYNTVHSTNSKALVILEHFCNADEEAALAAAGLKLWRNVNNAYCQSAMGYVDNSSFAGLTTWHTDYTANSLVGYMESHDEERMGYKQKAYAQTPLNSDLNARIKQLETNAAFFFTVSGPKMIWQFGELGYDYSINSSSDGSSVSDTYRTDPKPVHWDYYNVSQRKELYDTYSKLLALRNAYPTLFNQSSFAAWNVTQSFWSQGRSIYIKSSDGKRLVVVGNFTGNDISVSADFGETGTWYDYLSTSTLKVTQSTQSVSVPAHEFRIYTNFSTIKTATTVRYQLTRSRR